MRKGSGWPVIASALLGLYVIGATAPAMAQAQPAVGTQEDDPTLVLPAAQSHWVYVLEPVFPNLVVS